MGQKVNPHGLRVGIIRDWDSRWYASDEKVGDLLYEDYKIRTYLKETLYSAGVPKIEIERDSARVRIFLHTARPGMVIGRGGSEIEKLRAKLEKMLGKPVSLNIVEIRSPDLNAQLVAENIASQLEKRISYRRAMKQAMGRAMRQGARGIKTNVSVVLAALRLHARSIITKELYHCRHCVPTLTMASQSKDNIRPYRRKGMDLQGEVLQTSGRKLTRSLEPQRQKRPKSRSPSRW